jgi:hypothetical protein
MTLFLPMTCPATRRRTRGRKALRGISVTKHYIGLGHDAFAQLGHPTRVRVYTVHSDLEIVSAQTGLAVHRVGRHYEIRRKGLTTFLKVGRHQLVGKVSRNVCKVAYRRRKELPLVDVANKV